MEGADTKPAADLIHGFPVVLQARDRRIEIRVLQAIP